MEYAVAIAAIIGLVNIVDLIEKKLWWSVIKAVLGLVVGLVAGYFGWFGLPGMEVGFLVGLGQSGVYKGLQVVGAVNK